jgi:polyisoprenyl-teichoic acid--peptidoglycan teichoic acid transferase
MGLMGEARNQGLSQRAIALTINLLRIVLIGTILILAWKALVASVDRSADYAEVQGREEAYRATATALAPTGDAAGAAGHRALIAQISFATNTPGASEAPPALTATPPAPPPTSPLALPTLLVPADPDIPQAGGTQVPPRASVIPRDYNLVNVLLLGGDDEVTGDGFVRTDSMIIVSVNMDTGTVSMLSLPRDLYVYIPSGTMQRLNTAYGIGENIGWTDGGWGLLRQTIFYNLGINVHYYAKVDFSGFEQIIDTLGGVDIAVDCAYQDYYPVADFDPSRPVEENYALRTLPVGYYTMDGFDALWYARTRKSSDDFDRGRRQLQILWAIFSKIRETDLLTNLPTLWDQALAVVETNLTFDTMLNMLPIALSLDPTSLETFSFNRLYHTTPWQTPAGDYVQLPVPETVSVLMSAFYQPPAESQIAASGPRIEVQNGTERASLDLVAASRLRLEGFGAFASGASPETGLADTILIDYVGEDKGSPVPEIMRLLNIPRASVQVQPDPNRTVDYRVILGESYNSCTYNVLPPTG